MKLRHSEVPKQSTGQVKFPASARKAIAQAGEKKIIQFFNML